MSLSGVMTNALAGMKVTQSGLEVVSQNISNADSVGYIRRKISAVEQPLGDMSGFARTTGVQRLLDRVVQRQLWSETSGAGYTATRSNMLNALDQVYGPPASGNTLGAVFSRFTQSLQQLKADPSNTTLRSSVAVAAQDMATRLGGLSSDVQSLRLEAEEGLAAGVARSNEILKQIQSVNTKITATPNAASSASLNDERDRLVTELSRYIDIRTSEDGNGSLNIFTSSGVTLFGGSNAVTLSFDAAGAMSADALWNTDDAQRGVGTCLLYTSDAADE